MAKSILDGKMFFILIAVALSFLFLNSNGYLSVTEFEDTTYIPHYAYAECTAATPFNGLTEEIKGGSEVWRCDYQSCTISKVYSDSSKVTVNGNTYSSSETTQVYGKNKWVIDIPDIQLKYRQTVSLKWDTGCFLFWCGTDNSVVLDVQAVGSVIQVKSADASFAPYSLEEHSCDFGLIESKDPTAQLDTAQWEIGQVVSFIQSYEPVNKLLFTNSKDEICYNNKLWDVKAVSGKDVLVAKSGTVEACSHAECQAKHGDGYYVNDNWQCVADITKAKECYTNADAGGTRCEDGKWVGYTCVSGEVKRAETDQECCAVQSDCPTDRPICSLGVCYAESVTYETCGPYECCVGFKDSNYDPSIESIYEYGKACPDGMFCNMPEGSFVGNCQYTAPPEPTIDCSPEGKVEACSVGGKAGTRVCLEDNTWGQCKVSGESRNYDQILLAIGAIIVIAFVVWYSKRKMKK